jgi:hypothetical protein
VSRGNAAERLDQARGDRPPEALVAAEIRRVRSAESDPREQPPPEGTVRPPQRPVGYSFAEAIEKPLTTSYCIKGFARPGEITVLFGESGALKSFVGIDAALHYASGSSRWLGNRVRGPGGVLFIIGEGAPGFPKRLRVWAMERGVSELPAYVHPAAVDLFDGPELLHTVIEQAEEVIGCAVSLIVVDPLGVMFGCGDESKNPDVARVFNNLRLALGGQRAAILIHHVGHGDKARERGAYTVRSNADARFQVEYQESTKVLTVGHLKEKENALSDPAYLAAKVVVLGTDDDGDPISSLVLEPTAERPADVTEWKGAVKKTDQEALRVLARLWLSNGRAAVLSATWRQELHREGMLPEKGQADDSAANARAFQRTAKVLREADLVGAVGFGKATSYAPKTPGVGLE